MSSVHQPDINGSIVYRCAQAGCRECLERLLQYHRRLVYRVLNEQHLNGLPEEDAVQVGMVGLWKAICGFDPDRGVPFASYAGVAIERRLWLAAARERAGSLLAIGVDADLLTVAEETDPLAMVEERWVVAGVLAQLPVRLG